MLDVCGEVAEGAQALLGLLLVGLLLRLLAVTISGVAIE